jgi:hypothetical protein
VPGKERCRFHGGCSTGALTDEGKARSLAAMHDGWQRWLEKTRAAKALGEIDRFPGGRKSGARWITPRMRELREIEAMRRVQDARDALRPPCPPARRHGRPTIIARAQAQILRSHPGWRASPRTTWPGWPRPGVIWREGRAGRDRGRIFRGRCGFRGRLLPFHRARSGAAIPSSGRRACSQHDSAATTGHLITLT